MLDFYDLVIIGGGPAGLAAALSARENGLGKILIAERDNCLGGILNQCIHNGFGLHYFKEELTGPEYAGRFIKKLAGSGIDCALDTMVLEIARDKSVKILNKKGYRSIGAGSVIIATGCRERTRGAIAVPGERPAGIFTAGTAQRYVNIEGLMPGRKALILGSGDIGLIMARRMTLEGAEVAACVELMPYSGGLTRNIVQCLEDYNIPLYLSHTLIDIQGKKRVERVIAARVDENRKPVPGSEKVFDCDTVLLSVGLIPENELSRGAGIEIDPRTNGAFVYENMETSSEGIFACGNAVHVHDLADFVTEEGFRAGKAAAGYILKGGKSSGGFINVNTAGGVSYTVPQRITTEALESKTDLFFRVNRVFGRSEILVRDGENIIRTCRRERMSPGEMERISLPPCSVGGLTVEAKEV
ncbi:MAG: NAD(P)/FAD-dependent oxidoreductase [Oscillospiraceae bacterium]|jgi:NADPH-dependent 2,4-dienoyl-CoA reductase/sulfur reductase-like enzyme|nr:NAD(P)/FAD-dependent oxidoreductase [Oscillospiraceae bacterium]